MSACEMRYILIGDEFTHMDATFYTGTPLLVFVEVEAYARTNTLALRIVYVKRLNRLTSSLR